MKTRNNSFPANAKSVDDISAMVQDYLLNCGVERGICLRMRLVVEEMLIPLLGKSSGIRGKWDEAEGQEIRTIPG